ncbi:40S small subunit ribosomal protein uS5 (rpS2) [Andalucia godoyi]|uniref:Small ribosomal subunit protein uS5 n=1 Tax=Andalucia godoyi TaxID=505711 RepID=A0A8K0AK25_ANDGO|nr:40S small subunit ribosomal protein uS5 (rpS2) [Andalucia godoyi]WCZ58583.1 40S ribosomal protein S2 [Andalucia godoyi]|eukprot:ANDGO_07533.mRNA.1 40S small subunit ribosomal protein uS5 (rpS2)
MADTAAADQTAPSRGGFGRRGGDRNGGERGPRPAGDRPPRRGPRRDGGKGEEKGWVPFTKLGRLVRDGKISSLEQIYSNALPIKEAQIIDHFLGGKLKEEVMKVMPVQKQTRAGQRTRFKACVVVGDRDGHVGLGYKSASEVANAIKGAMTNAKLSLIPVRRGFWGNKIGNAHTVPVKVTGKCGSVMVRLVPAPRGTGLVAASAPKKVLELAGIEDVYSSTAGHTKTMGNFVHATFLACAATYHFLTPDLWKKGADNKVVYSEFSDFLAKSAERRRA